VDFDHLKQIKIMKISVNSAEARHCYMPLKFGQLFYKPIITNIMRICAVSILVLTTSLQLLSATPVKSQDIDQTKVRMELKKASLIDAIHKIEAQSRYTFIYNERDVRKVKNISLIATDQPISSVLKSVLANTSLTFKQVEDKIFINTESPLALSATAFKESATANFDKTITGTVTDETGQTLIGVSVVIKGNNSGVTTNEKGQYRISVPDNVSVLTFTYVGYISEDVTVVGTTANVQLKSDTKALSDVVVVGYGTQKRANVTAAISSVNSKTLNELPVVSVTQALQGRVAGLNVVNNGTPGSEPVITIRGVSSINSSNTPLYVVDGFPTGSIGNFDPKDIESVEVLKDASSAAIYGSRGTNGVIIITTKKATGTQRPTVSFDSYVGVQNVWKTIDLLNTTQYLQYERALNGAAGIALPPRLQPANFNQPIYAGATQTFAQTNTDWQNEYFQKNALIQQQSISLTGGSAANHYYVSAGYFSQDGVAKNVNYNRINLRINSDYKISNVFTFGENATISQGIQKGDAGGNRSPLANVTRMQPYLPVYNPTSQDGFYGL